MQLNFYKCSSINLREDLTLIRGVLRLTNRQYERHVLTHVIREVPLETVKNEPAFLPRLDFAAHLHQVALAHLLGEDDEGTGVDAVA